jgi:ligand-binding SRPBCC domain-containing protein
VAQRVRQAVEIKAPVERVFGFLDDPENSLALVPQLVEVREVAPLPNGGHRMRFVTLGRRGKLCEWVSEQLERVPNELVVVRAQTEGVTTTATRRFEEAGQGTRLQGDVEYRFDVPWPQRILLPVMEFQARRAMRKQLRSLLGLVKVRMEARL